MEKHWDNIIKALVKANPQAFVSLLLDGAQFDSELNTELKTGTLLPDLLYTVIWNDKKIVLHVEFQRRKDGLMGRRLLEYNVLARRDTQLPVYSIVMYLMRDGRVVESPYQELLPNGNVIHIFYFKNIKLWELPADIFRQTGLEGMLPLLPLTEEGKQHKVIEEMVDRLQAVGDKDLLTAGFTIASLVFKEATDKQWLQERFMMMEELFEDAWLYQEIVEKGMAKGMAKGMEQGLAKGIEQGLAKGVEQGVVEGKIEEARLNLTRITQKRFPKLTPLARQQSMLLEDLDTLRNLSDILLDTQTEDEAREMLLKALQNDV